MLQSGRPTFSKPAHKDECYVGQVVKSIKDLELSKTADPAQNCQYIIQYSHIGNFLKTRPETKDAHGFARGCLSA